MYFQYYTYSDFISRTSSVLEKSFNLPPVNANHFATDIFNRHILRLKDSCTFIVEINYVDKFYRDTYYHYFSSKLNKYDRDVVKISIFDGELREEYFRDATHMPDLHSRYRGFFILRPTEPQIFGRSVISPKALKEHNFVCCLAVIPSSANAIKLQANGFPHASQDTEAITCAETTLWAIMEYFSHKYPEYKPILPSNISNALYHISVERRLPSKGMQIGEISFSLNQFGFGAKIYDRGSYNDSSFYNRLSCYIESGIPIIIAFDNQEAIRLAQDKLSRGEDAYLPTQQIVHVAIAIGRQNIAQKMIKNMESSSPLFDKEGVQLYDFDDIPKKFVVIDDNCPSYQLFSIDAPTKHYENLDWECCKINYFIAPLYKKIYLEAEQAKNFIYSMLMNGPMPLVPFEGKYFVKTFLASSRTYREYIALESSIDHVFKEFILELNLPKFIWVTEISNSDLLQNNQANGLLILDATESNINYQYEPLLLMAHGDSLLKYADEDKIFKKIPISLHPFFIFDKNLK